MFMTTGTLARQLKDAQHVVVFTCRRISGERNSNLQRRTDGTTGALRSCPTSHPRSFHKRPESLLAMVRVATEQGYQARPNGAHVAIAELARHVPKLTVVTQNVDDLHERAGSQDVIHLHGSLHSPRCIDCGLAYQLSTSPQALPEEGSESSHLSAVPETGMLVLEWFGSVKCYSRGMAGRAGSCR